MRGFLPDETRISQVGNPLVNWDRDRIDQVISHLLANAYTFGGGKAVELRVDARDAFGRLITGGQVVWGTADSSVFRVSPRLRNSVMSWYLRLHNHDGHDALWGLVRVEMSECNDPTERADEISRWILAETNPLALPDGRWDKMSYGIRDVEEFLRAIS